MGRRDRYRVSAEIEHYRAPYRTTRLPRQKAPCNPVVDKPVDKAVKSVGQAPQSATGSALVASFASSASIRLQRVIFVAGATAIAFTTSTRRG